MALSTCDGVTDAVMVVVDEGVRAMVDVMDSLSDVLDVIVLVADLDDVAAGDNVCVAVLVTVTDVVRDIDTTTD